MNIIKDWLEIRHIKKVNKIIEEVNYIIRNFDGGRNALIYLLNSKREELERMKQSQYTRSAIEIIDIFLSHLQK